jgi:hypothetical protein
MRTITKIRPGLLVGLKTQVRGGVRYHRLDIEESADGCRKRWETEREIDDPAEHERAGKTRQKARSLICRACVNTSFGLLCPNDREAELDAAIEAAQGLAQAHNLAARTTEISVRVIKGRVAATDEEAARAIAGEMAELVDAMLTGIRSMDPGAIRDAASRARASAAMLDDAAKERAQRAVEVARDAARAIVRRISKAGEDVATVMRDLESDSIQPLRVAYLDFAAGEAHEALPAIAVQRFAEQVVDQKPAEAPNPGGA